MSSSSKKVSKPSLFFLIAGLILMVLFVLTSGSIDSSDILKMAVGIFKLVVVIGFYFYFAFGAPGLNSTIKRLAPCILLVILNGAASVSFPGNDVATNYLNSIGSMAWMLVIVCGFVFLFVHSKIIGTVFGFASCIYGFYTFVAFIVALIVSLVNGQSVVVMSIVKILLLVAALILMGFGAIKTSKSRDW